MKWRQCNPTWSPRWSPSDREAQTWKAYVIVIVIWPMFVTIYFTCTFYTCLWMINKSKCHVSRIKSLENSKSQSFLPSLKHAKYIERWSRMATSRRCAILSLWSVGCECGFDLIWKQKSNLGNVKWTCAYFTWIVKAH